MKTDRYASDLNDEEWAILEALIPLAKEGGRPRRINMREVVNGIFYLLKTGCQWRMLPKDFPKWKTVNAYFSKWRQDGRSSSGRWRIPVKSTRNVTSIVRHGCVVQRPTRWVSRIEVRRSCLKTTGFSWRVFRP